MKLCIFMSHLIAKIMASVSYFQRFDFLFQLKKVQFFEPVMFLYQGQNMSVNCSTLSSSCHFFCHLLESGLARINWIRAVDKICVEQLICCQKCRANDCRAIAFRAVHPHSTVLHYSSLLSSLLISDNPNKEMLF